MERIQPLYAKASKMETKIEFVVHKTAKSVVLGFFRRDYPKTEDDKILDKKTEVKLLMGKRWKDGATVRDIIKWVQSVGIWGYCQHKGKNHKEIHYWLGSKADRYSVLEFILHEVYHAGGYSSENTACKLAGLGCFAYQVFERDFEKKLR
jgi:hypothetical protein